MAEAQDHSNVPEPTVAPILALVRDLLFSSKITAEARAAGHAVRVIRDPALLADLPGARLIVDLNLNGAIDAAARWMHRTGGVVVGFVAHIDSATIRQARQAGIKHIVARSELVLSMPRLLGIDARSA